MHTAFKLSTCIVELWYTEPWANIGKQHDLIFCHDDWVIWTIVSNTVMYFCWSYNSCLFVFWSMKYFTLHSNKKRLKVFCSLEAMLLWFVPFAYHLIPDSPSEIIEKHLHKLQQTLQQLLFFFTDPHKIDYLVHAGLFLTCWWHTAITMTSIVRLGLAIYGSNERRAIRVQKNC